ncbi:MAG: hypothetical protein HRT36_09340 [Alphaproteobacteria bacterium]|nr:hypothetical protein [Alphaproteobacteria bacterium]
MQLLTNRRQYCDSWRYRAGALVPPMRVRVASTLFSFGHDDAYNFEDDITYLSSGVAILGMPISRILTPTKATTTLNAAYAWHCK